MLKTLQNPFVFSEPADKPVLKRFASSKGFSGGRAFPSELHESAIRGFVRLSLTERVGESVLRGFTTGRCIGTR